MEFGNETCLPLVCMYGELLDLFENDVNLEGGCVRIFAEKLQSRGCFTVQLQGRGRGECHVIEEECHVITNELIMRSHVITDEVIMSSHVITDELIMRSHVITDELIMRSHVITDEV